MKIELHHFWLVLMGALIGYLLRRQMTWSIILPPEHLFCGICGVRLVARNRSGDKCARCAAKR